MIKLIYSHSRANNGQSKLLIFNIFKYSLVTSHVTCIFPIQYILYIKNNGMPILSS